RSAGPITSNSSTLVRRRESEGRKPRDGRPWASGPSGLLLDRLVLDLLEGDDSAGVVALQREVPLLVRVLRIGKLDRLLAVYGDGDRRAVGDHLLGEELVRAVRGGVHHQQLRPVLLAHPERRVQAAGPDRVAMSGVDLRLVPLREARPERGPEVLPA